MNPTMRSLCPLSSMDLYAPSGDPALMPFLRLDCLSLPCTVLGASEFPADPKQQYRTNLAVLMLSMTSTDPLRAVGTFTLRKHHDVPAFGRPLLGAHMFRNPHFLTNNLLLPNACYLRLQGAGIIDMISQSRPPKLVL